MPSPFPGMDPYLERPDLWPGLHVGLINWVQSQLNPKLLPNYIAKIETRIYVVRDDDPARRQFVADVGVQRRRRAKSGKATSTSAIAEPVVFPVQLDPEVQEARIEIQDRRRNSLVTVIEILSPSNKVRGSEGRESLLAKRRETVASPVHWLEIDLLRGGEPTIVPLLPPSDYRIYLSRADDRLRVRGWLPTVRQPLPVIGVPLGKKDPDVSLDLGAVLTGAYDQGGYAYLIDYRRPPTPPLNPADARWANQLLRQKGLR